MKHMVDLHAGLGGASEAMVMDEEWNVLRIDNNPLLQQVECMVIDDVKSIRDNVESNWLAPKIDLIWSSPPCRDFSNAYSSPKSIHGRKHGIESYKPDMTLVIASIEIIEKVKPKYWVIENVVGAIRHFKELLGEPRQIIGPGS